MRLDQRGFKQLFRGSPILRAKRGGLLRNAAVALGNARDASAIPSLAEALRDPDPLVRSHAAWALGQIGGPKARAILEDAIAREADQAVRGEIVLAIEE
jgi:epoxyqueuosine reductase